MKLVIKGILTKPNDILEFAYNAQEKLRLKHNEEGAKATNGTITMEDFRLWQEQYFMPRQDAISMEIVKARQELLKSNVYDINLDTEFN